MTITTSNALCKRCGEKLIPGSDFCIYCGTPVVRGAVAQGPSNLDSNKTSDASCPHCGEPISSSDVYCAKCGGRITTSTPQQDVANAPVRGASRPAGPKGTGTVVVKTGENGSPVVGRCVKCHAPIYEGDSFCTYCSKTVTKRDLFNTSSDQPETAQKRKSSKPSAAKANRRNASTARPRTRNAGRNSSGIDPNDDDPTMLSRLLVITEEEAVNGCRKTLEAPDGQVIEVDVPAGVNPATKIDIPGLGREDERTGMRGPLRVSLYIAR